MQGFERMDRQLLDAGGLVGHLVRESSMFAFLAAHRAEVFPDADYADLFCPDRGRPSVPATQMAAVMTLQTLHDLSDRETAEAVRFDVRWKVAIGASLDDAGFDPSTLVYWRGRIARSGRPHRVGDAVKKVGEAPFRQAYFGGNTQALTDALGSQGMQQLLADAKTAYAADLARF